MRGFAVLLFSISTSTVSKKSYRLCCFDCQFCHSPTAFQCLSHLFDGGIACLWLNSPIDHDIEGLAHRYLRPSLYVNLKWHTVANSFIQQSAWIRSMYVPPLKGQLIFMYLLPTLELPNKEKKMWKSLIIKTGPLVS